MATVREEYSCWTPDSFEVLGKWELDRGPQYFGYDFWWHLGYDTLISSEWGTPNMVESGVNPEILLKGGYGHSLHVWDLRKRRHVQALDLGAEQQMVLELRPAHDPAKAYGFVGVVVSLKDLSASIWLWHREKDNWAIKKVIEIPAEPADPEKLPPLLKGFKAVPPLVTDINLSLDDKFLYVSFVGHRRIPAIRRLRSFPSETYRLRPPGRNRAASGASARSANSAERRAANGGSKPRRQARLFHQLALRSLGRAVLSRRRSQLDGQAGHQAGGRNGPRPEIFLEFDGLRSHQVHLEGGDASSDSYCYS